MPAIDWELIKPGSSPIDWCEENYKVSPYIAEFFNTFSNILFILLPPLLISLHKQYARSCGKGIHLIWGLLIVVGTCSAYFHATLSLLGQLLDEIAILWVIMAGIAMWFPVQGMPSAWRNSASGRKKFSSVCFLFTLLATLMGFLQPVVNAFILLCLGLPITVLLVQHLRQEENTEVIGLGHRTVVLWVLAVICWLSDRLLCSLCTSIGFPYLHAAWHILIFLASYAVVVLFAYFEAKNSSEGLSPVLRWYPLLGLESIAIPFVEIVQSIEKMEKSKYTMEVNGNDIRWEKMR